MDDILAFILANKYVLLIGVVSLVVEVLSVTYLARNIKTDFHIQVTSMYSLMVHGVALF